MKATLVIKDETNVKINGLDMNLRKKLVNKFKFILPHARHTPAFKLGRWDGSIAFFQLGGSTFINLLPEIIPILMDAGYEIELEDLRTYRTDYTFDTVDKDSYNHVIWPKDHRLEGQPIELLEHQVDAINNFFLKHTITPRSSDRRGEDDCHSSLIRTMSKIWQDYSHCP